MMTTKGLNVELSRVFGIDKKEISEAVDKARAEDRKFHIRNQKSQG